MPPQRRQQWVIGTAADCDIRITDDPYASSYHCMIARAEDGNCTVRDLGSTNGTYIRRPGQNDRKVIGWKPLHPGEALVVGRTILPWRQQ